MSDEENLPVWNPKEKVNLYRPLRAVYHILILT